jgi:5-methylcytosine-specific restriction protein B
LNESGAENEFQQINAAGWNPWLIAVKLHDEPNALHVRCYLENPPVGLEHTSLQLVPEVVRKAISKLPSNAGGGAIELAPATSGVRAEKLVNQVLAILRREPNVLLVGPPGTGKTVALEDLRSVFDGKMGGVFFDPDEWHAAWSSGPASPYKEGKTASLVFHPSYSYEEFVAGLFPRIHNNQMQLYAKPGPLLSLAHWAAEADRGAALLIDEFNRGPTAAIFGDTLALLDGQKRQDVASGKAGSLIERPHSGEQMMVDPVFARKDGSREIGSQISLPASLNIVAALNSTDRSVAPLDAALRRRFAIVYVGPDYDALADQLGIPNADTFTPPDDDPATWSVEDIKSLALVLLKSLNSRIELALGQDFCLGHAFFWFVDGGSPDIAARALCQAFDEKIAASLRMTFVDQDEMLASILKIAAPGLATNLAEPRVASWRSPPSFMEAVVSPRLHMHEASSMPWSDALKALRAVL